MGILVAFPHGGRWRMLLWRTEWGGRHVVLARSHSAILTAAKAVAWRHQDAEILQYEEIDLWAPSQAMIERDHEINEWRVRDNFWDYIRWTAFHLCSGRKLPNGLKRCADCKEELSGCEACGGTRVIIDVTDREAFFLARRSAYEALDKSLSRKTHRVESRAAKADDKQELMIARADFGHHQKGVDLTVFEMPEVEHSYGFDDVLFFYTTAKRLPLDQVVKPLSAKKATLAQQEKIDKANASRKRDREKEEDWKRFVALIKGPG